VTARLRLVLARTARAERGVEHPRLLQIRAHLHPGQRHEPDAGIVHFARQQIGELASNLIRDTVGAGALRHRNLEFGIWNLELGIGNWELGIWNAYEF